MGGAEHKTKMRVREKRPERCRLLFSLLSPASGETDSVAADAVAIKRIFQSEIGVFFREN